MSGESPQYLLLYDGLCALCNGTVKFLLARDHRDQLRFASLQSELGRKVVTRHGGDPDQLHTLYLVEGYDTENEAVRTKGRAALRAIGSLGGIWRVANAVARLPKFILDGGYWIVARLRYRLFGRYDACPVPPANQRHKFIR